MEFRGRLQSAAAFLIEASKFFLEAGLSTRSGPDALKTKRVLGVPSLIYSIDCQGWSGSLLNLI